MSDNGKHAHEILCRQFSNVPDWDALSERSRGLLDTVGDSFAKMDEMNQQFRAAEEQLDKEATAVEASLREELGELQVRERATPPGMQMMNLDQLLNSLGLDPSQALTENVDLDDEDEDPTIH